MWNAYVCVHVHMQVNVCVCVCVYACVSVLMHVCVHGRASTSIFTMHNHLNISGSLYVAMADKRKVQIKGEPLKKAR